LFVARAQKRIERDEELRRSHEASRIEQETKTQGVNLYVKNIDGEWGIGFEVRFFLQLTLGCLTRRVG
jgi:hypothetical protein